MSSWVVFYYLRWKNATHKFIWKIFFHFIYFDSQSLNISVVNSERMIFFEAIHVMVLCYLFIQFLMSALVSDWFCYSIVYHETSKLVESSQTGLQWRISIGLSFVLESHNLTTLLKQKISYKVFYLNLKRAHQRIMFYVYVPPTAFVY